MINIKNKNIKWWMGIGSCVFLFIFIFVFSYEKMSFVFEGVKIEATIEKQDGSSLSVVKGNASKAVYLSLNGREVFIDRDGNFSESIVALPGFSIITLDAKDKFGKTALKQFKLVSNDPGSKISSLVHSKFTTGQDMP